MRRYKKMNPEQGWKHDDIRRSWIEEIKKKKQLQKKDSEKKGPCHEIPLLVGAALEEEIGKWHLL